MTDEYDPTAEPTVDLERVPFEVRRALEGAGYFVEMMEPGLRIRRDDGDDLVVVDCHGDDLASLPIYRLAKPDPELMRRAVAAALEFVPPHLADDLVEKINAGIFEVIAPPDRDEVLVHVDGFRLMRAHRRVLVTGWPEDDPE